LPLREVDRLTENNGGIPCPVCGETYGTFDNLKKHIEYNSLTETHDNVPVEGSHRDTNKVPPSYLEPARITEMDLRLNLLDKEVMVVVEGIEPLISGTFQALHSYTAEDIYFHGRFAPCMSTKDGNIYVDLLKFHEVTPRTGSTPNVTSRRKQFGL
jgi:hypothetical protein